ncbi:MAG TPA: hypothetical protein VK155_11575, partial [Bacteroidales bacterium]|nr:hypothetical protein [Bacteroidales bacterium]
KQAVSSYSSAYEVLKDPTVLMMIANVYDEDLKNEQKALSYYRQFVAMSGKSVMSPVYMESVKKQIDYLERKIAEEKAKKEYINQKTGTKKQ